MKFLRKRKTAVLITVAAAIAATLLGVAGTANRMTRDIEAMFYNGVYLKDEGYTQPGIDSHLNEASNAALGLATIMGNYPELSDKAEALISARSGLLSAKRISEKRLANLRMWASFNELAEAAGNVPPNTGMSERDKAAASKYTDTFRGAYIAISSSAYNDKVSEYLSGRSVLTRFLGAFVSASEPEYFYPGQYFTGN